MIKDYIYVNRELEVELTSGEIAKLIVEAEGTSITCGDNWNDPTVCENNWTNIYGILEMSTGSIDFADYSEVEELIDPSFDIKTELNKDYQIHTKEDLC